jgi:C4-dicarboxylate transporter, DcuC family
MALTGTLISIVFIVLAAFFLLKKYHPQAVLLLCGLCMMTLSLLLGYELKGMQAPTGLFVFDLFEMIKQSFSAKGAEVGLMIMAIGGYVAYMDKIGASEALVYLAMKPLSIFKKSPYLAASLVIPIGHFLSIPIPSATGLGLLLVASVFPVLIQLGVSRVSAVSVIVSTTVFDMGPASANTLRAAELIEKSNMSYFIEDQFSIAAPLIVLMAVLYFFVNRYYDRKESRVLETEDAEIKRPAAPLIYALLPIFPLILLLVFSELFAFFEPQIKLSTTTAMFLSLAVAMLFEYARKLEGKAVLDSLKAFWEAMGRVFATVITLIIAAEVFSNGLISLRFIDSLVYLSQHLGFGAVGIGALMTVMIFGASILMGSGNASFFSFGPLVPDIASKLGADPASIILPMQLSSSLGRAISPIAGVVIATSEIAGVTPLEVAKRNFLPLTITLIAMLILSL